MSGSSNQQDPQKLQIIKKRSFAFRLNLFFFMTFILFSILIVRLAILQLVEGEAYAAREIQNELRTTTIPPIRGNIYDRNGNPIAYSTSTQTLYYRLNNERAETLIAIADKLAYVFATYGDPQNAISAEEIMKRMDAWYGYDGKSREPKEYSFVPRRIKTDLTEREIAYFVEHRDEFPGFEIVEESIRNYVYDDDGETGIAVQLVGYLRQFSTAKNLPDSYLNYYKDEELTYEYLPNENVGLDGIEFMYQEQLRGKNGYRTYTVDSAGNIIREVAVQPPVKGSDIYLTIDRHVQLAAEKAIKDHLEFMKSEEASKNNFGMGAMATTGYAVAMEVDTGKVIAMVSYPDYDPNIWRGGSITVEDYNKYQYFFKNGTIRESYPNYEDDEERKKHPTSLVYLGSTVKPLSVLIGLEEGLFTQYDYYMDTGEYFYGRDNRWRIQNSNFQKNGRINAEDAIRVSSNTFMAAMVGERLAQRQGGLEIWNDWMEKFGLGVSTGSGLPAENIGIKDYYHEARNASTLSALVRAAWGQQAKYTTLQLAQYAAMLANRGERLKPQFVEKIVSPDGEIVEQFEKVVLNTVDIKEEYWNVVHRGMLKVFRQGFDGFPYQVAAKTGTSTQQVYGGEMKNNAVFIAYAPADKPKLAVAVVVPEGGYGAYGAAPIARAIFDAYDEAIGLTGVPRASYNLTIAGDEQP